MKGPESIRLDESQRNSQNDREGRLGFKPNKGSHRQYKHAFKSGLVTVSGHPGDNIHPKTERSILKQAGLK
jgi:predicted RNA binding protein YcfA (HicA-like mRNA interferase family)